MVSQTIEQAIAHYKAGNKNEARNLLALILKEQPNNENAWLWMSVCVDAESQMEVILF